MGTGLGLAVVALALASCGKPAPRATPRDAGHVAASHAAGTDPGSGAPPQRAATDVIIAVDQSSSMAGFAHKESIGPLIDTMAAVLRQGDVAPDHVHFFSVGAEIRPVAEREILDAGRFNDERADLVEALDAPAIAGADVAVIVTDGQPSSRQIFEKPCTQLSTEDATGLAPKLEAALGAGSGVWLILERIDFDGTFYLNCHTPTPAITAAVRERRGSCKGRECSYRHAGERVILTIVKAAPEVVASGARYVEAYVARRTRATAIRLHRAVADRWTAGEPVVAIVGRRAAAAVTVKGTAGAWQASVQCPTRESGVRLCMRARSPARDKARPLVGLANARTVLAPASAGDLYELPAGTTFDHHQLPGMQAWNYDSCKTVWDRYRELVREARTPAASSCVAGGDELATEIALACGCLGGEPRHETIQLSQVYSIDQELANTMVGERYSADEAWFSEPDRINGLSELFQKIGRFWSGKIGEQGEATVIGSLQLTVLPAR